MQIKVAIVDDDKDMRISLATLIRRTPSLQLAGNYPNAETALEEIPRQLPHVVLMDINMPGMSGIECVRQLKALLPAVQVLMLTVYEDSDSLFNSLKAGASGYLLKRTTSTELLQAVRDVHGIIGVGVMNGVHPQFGNRSHPGSEHWHSALHGLQHRQTESFIK